MWVDVCSTLGKVRSHREIERFLDPFRSNFVDATRSLIRRMFLPSTDPHLVEWVVADMSAAPPTIAIDALKYAISNDDAILAGLPQVPAAIVAINPGFRPTDVEGLRAHGVKAVIMPGVGHFPMIEDPEAFNHVLEEALDGFG